MKLIVGEHEIDLRRPVVMTIINITPDSFFSGSRTRETDQIVHRVEQAIADGAALVDVGGYSSRPGAEDVSEQEEFRRLSVGLELIRKHFPMLPVSIDTFRSRVMEQVLASFGPCIVNDISGGEADPSILEVAARYQVPFIAMHMRGTPQTMQNLTRYENLTETIHRYFCDKIEWLRHSGIRQIILDPGFGFSKTIEQNFLLLHELSAVFEGFEYPFLAGVSRKSMIYKTLDTTPEDALIGTTALHWECLCQGASILRVHDTREAAQVVRLYNQFSAASVAHT